MINAYSRVWFELFLETRPYTEEEVAFVIRHLPHPRYRKVLDLCCGEGRHTNALANKGYEMVGVDLDAEALAIAARRSAGATMYLKQDMRDLEQVPGQFDGIISLWQSFGYFDGVTNCDIMQQISRKLSLRGRFILDLYNRAYWMEYQAERQIERKGVLIQAKHEMIGKRLRSSLVYGNGLGSDTFEWELYTFEEIQALGEAFGLRMLLACTECDETKPVTSEKPTMQIAFEKYADF